MRPERPVIAFVAALLTVAPLAAATTPPVAAAPASDIEVGETLQAALGRARAGDCKGALALADPLVGRVSDADTRRAVQMMRLTCLGDAGRIADLKATYDEVAAADPNNPVIRNLGVLIAADMGDFTLAGERLASFAEQRPRDLSLMTGENWRGISQGLVLANKLDLRRRVSVALARAGWQPADRPEIAEAVTSDAIEDLIANNELPEARSMLARISAPELYFSMATERVYAPLWPDVQSAMGPESKVVVDAFAAQKLEDNARNPADMLALRDAVRAYLLLGRPADADLLAAPVPVADGMSEEAVAVVRYHAQALYAQGQVDRAIARLKPLIGLDFTKTPSAASGAISLAEIYHDSNKPEDELALSRAILARKDDVLSAWGRGWLKRSEVCALADLRRAAEVKTAGDALLAAAGDNAAASIEGMLCAGRSDDAAKIAVATLAKPDGADLIADQFQPTGALWSVGPSRLRDMWTPFLARPDVKAAFVKVARILPKTLWPSRTPRPIPREPGAAPLSDTV